MENSIAEHFFTPEDPEGHLCGYCKSKDTNISEGMWMHYLTVEDYQDLIDRGWRRSGKYCYKPLMNKTCCPMYTISCKATEFRISKSQKGVLKKMTKYLVEGIDGKKGTGGDSTEAGGIGVSGREAGSESDAIPRPKELSTTTTSNASSDAKQEKMVRPGVGADPSKPTCKKAKVLRQERIAKKKELPSGATYVSDVASSEEVKTKKRHPTPWIDPSSDSKDSIPDFLKVGLDGSKPLEAFLTLPPLQTGQVYAHTLEIKCIKSSPPSREFKATYAESFSLYKKYQMNIHGDSESDCKESTFKRFLCDSPLLPKKGKEGWLFDYGSYHCHYRIDGKLVAVGVVDILPKCASSVYLFYDTDYKFLNMGVYTALRETEMVRKLHLGDPVTFKYYYMGYYIHSCQKMRYKGNYYPSFILCPESYCFMPIESCIPKFERNRYSRLNDRETAPEDASEWLDKCLILLGHNVIKYSTFRELVSEEKDAAVRKYAELVGPKVASRMWLVLQV